MNKLTRSPSDANADGQPVERGQHVRVVERGYDYTGVVIAYYRNGGWYVKDDRHGCTCVHMAGSLTVIPART